MDIHGSFSFLPRFRWVFCQIAHLRRCLPGRIRHALNKLPWTIDRVYDHALQEIDKEYFPFAYRLLQCVAVAFRPLRVAELAEVLSFNFQTTPVPKFHEDWRQGDPVHAVLSLTSCLLAIVNAEGSRVVQFSHPSVEEYLTSARLAETNDIISRYFISMTPAHTLAAQLCLAILLHLDKNIVNRDSLEKYPLVEYAAEHWVDHVRFEGVSGNVQDGTKRLFDPNKPYLEVCVWLHNPEVPTGKRGKRTERPLPLTGTPLHYAVLWSLHFIVEFLIVEHSQDVNSRGFTDNATPLHLASKCGKMEVARMLLNHGADVTAQNKDGETPLHLASQEGQEEVARMLIEHGANVAAQDKGGWNPLHLVLSAGRVELVRIFIEHPESEIARGKDKWTPLRRPPFREYIDVAQILFSHGVGVTTQDRRELTPLHLASGGHAKLALILLKWSADATARDWLGWTSPHPTSSEEHVELTRVLLERGAAADARDSDNGTPLHWASEQAHPEVVRFLLWHGVDADARDNDNCTPLHWASQQGHLKVVRVLVEHGIDVNARDHSNWTPLHGASQHAHLEVVQFLLEHGADAHASDQGGWTSLQWPSYNGNPEIVRMLLEHGADANTRDNNNWTPLHGASQQGHREVVQVLLEHGADAESCDDSNQTPLDIASREGHLGLVQLLVESRANMDVRKTEVLVNGHHDVIQLTLLSVVALVVLLAWLLGHLV